MGIRRLPAEIRDWFRAVSTLAGVAVSMVRRRVAAPPADSQCSAHPVVIIPGVLEPWRFLMPLGDWLAEQGHPVHYVDALGLNLKDLATSAADVLTRLDDDDLRSAVIVAHSKGGLIGKAVMASPDVGDRVAGMVTVGTPFHGSGLGGPLQRLPLVSRSPFGMFISGSDALMTLSQQERVNERIVSLAPEWDQVVEPSSTRLEGATNIPLKVSGHFRPVMERAVWELVHHYVHALLPDD